MNLSQINQFFKKSCVLRVSILNALSQMDHEMRCLNGKRTQAIGFKTEILDGQELKKNITKIQYSNYYYRCIHTSVQVQQLETIIITPTLVRSVSSVALVTSSNIAAVQTAGWAII